jgi:prephenate dehydrogenase
MRIGVFGLGRFGKFWAESLFPLGDVVGYNRTAKIQSEFKFPLVPLSDLAKCDVVFLCVTISSLKEVAATLQKILTKKTLVIDTCSVKVKPLEILRATFPKTVSIIGTHPMFGPDSAKSGICGFPIIITRCRSSKREYAHWRDNFSKLGLSIAEMTAVEHDREAAYTQGVTHFIGRVLNDLELKQSAIGTLGYEKLLEIVEQTCNDPWQLFIDLQHYNPYTEEMRLALRQSLERILAKLEHRVDNQGGQRYDGAGE